MIFSWEAVVKNLIKNRVNSRDILKLNKIRNIFCYTNSLDSNSL